MTFPDDSTQDAYVDLAGVTATEARHADRWWPGRINTWIHDAAGWHAFFTPEDDARPGLKPVKPAGAPLGWLDLAELRPADHPTPMGYAPGHTWLRDQVDPSWWPPDGY